jgi:hypothetical protein
MLDSNQLAQIFNEKFNSLEFMLGNLLTQFMEENKRNQEFIQNTMMRNYQHSTFPSSMMSLFPPKTPGQYLRPNQYGEDQRLSNLHKNIESYETHSGRSTEEKIKNN